MVVGKLLFLSYSDACIKSMYVLTCVSRVCYKYMYLLTVSISLYCCHRKHKKGDFILCTYISIPVFLTLKKPDCSPFHGLHLFDVSVFDTLIRQNYLPSDHASIQRCIFGVSGVRWYFRQC